MTQLASGREPLLRVIGIIGAVVIFLMARHAGGNGDGVVVRAMAVRALARRDRVGAVQREPRRRVIRELCRYPRGKIAVAGGAAADGERRRHLRVGGVGGVVVVGLMAGLAGRAGDVVEAIGGIVAILAGARRDRVLSGQSEADGRVIKLGTQPGVGGMTTLARCSGEAGSCRMIRCCRAVEIFLMATDALGRHAREVRQPSTLVAILASRGRMRAG